MIINFEKYTHELTDKEKKMVPRIIGGLMKRVGKELSITNKEICDRLKKEGISITGPRLRKIIHFIRVEKIIKNIIATSNGYYIATERKEIDDYKQSLKERISSQQNLLNSYE